MNPPHVITGALHRVQRGHRKGLSAGPPPEPVRRPARVAMMMALAHKVREAIRDGRVTDQAEAARRLGVNRARISQLLDLTHLAPDIQERVLLLDAIEGVQPLHERTLRPITRQKDWRVQRAMFDDVFL